ncbi:MAG: hypothetical protein DHS20C13_26220 [Thermodesulfobacteriota bacterium]|nr:MAG: hypothetical protein DHS20C13_26220 [Thermodesulfobacteriota bacterium]
MYFDDGNTPKCLVYDFVNQKCDSCIDGHHLSHDHCCPDDWYYSTDACVENTIDGCEVQDDAENCDVCEDGLHSPKCCASDEYLDTDTTECTTIPLVDCKEYN